MEKRKLAKIAMLTAAMVAGADSISVNQVNAQIYVPTNYLRYQTCLIQNPNPGQSSLGGQCVNTGGNCLSFASCG